MPLRYREDGFEAKCSYCGEFLPITLEFWQPVNGMARCKACWRLYQKLYVAGRRGDEIARAYRREVQRLKYHANRAKRLAASAAWKARNRDRCAAHSRAWRARQRERSAA